MSAERTGGMLIFCLAFLFIFATLLTFLALSPEFLYSGKTYAQTSIQEEWHGISLVNYKETKNFTLDDFGSEIFDIGGRNLRLDWERGAYGGEGYIKLVHRYGFGLLWYEDMNWFNEANIERVYYPYPFTNPLAGLNKVDLDEDYASFGRLQYIVKAHVGAVFQIETNLVFNSSYSTPSEAWEHNALIILFGITPDNSNTQLDVWNIIAQLILFQAPNIFGTTGVIALGLNAIIAFPFWVCTIYLATKIILWFIPFLGGA